MKTILFLLFLFQYSLSQAQYSYAGSIYNSPYHLNFDVNTTYKLSIKGKGKHLFIYEKNPVEDSVSIKVLKLDLDKEKISDSFFLPKIPKSFLIDDIIAGDDAEHSFLVGMMGVYSFTGNKSWIDTGSYPYTKNYRGLKHISRINDSLVLIFQYYNYHPNNGPSGMHLHLYNTNTKSFLRSKTIKHPGIALSSISTLWAVADEQYIYLFAGLTARVYKYDWSFDLVSEYELPLFSAEQYSKNLAYEARTDSIIYTEWKDMYNYIQWKKTVDTGDKNWRVVSEYYSKDGIMGKIKEVRENYPFIEKVIKINSDEVILTICRPGYQFKMRDVYRYDLKKNRITKKIEKWHTGRADTLNKVEDYFGIYVENDQLVAPYFYKNHAYLQTSYNPALFEKGSKEFLNEKYFNYTKQHGYKWQILKYRLEGW